MCLRWVDWVPCHQPPRGARPRHRGAAGLLVPLLLRRLRALHGEDGLRLPTTNTAVAGPAPGTLSLCKLLLVVCKGVLQQMSQGSRKGAPRGECGKCMVVRVCQQICLCDLVDHRCWHAHRPPRRRQSEPTDSPLCVCVHKDARTRHHNSCKVGPRHCWQDVKGAQHATVCHCHPSPTMGRPTGNLMCSPPANLPAPRAPHAITLDSKGLCNRAPRPDRGPGHRRRAPV